MDQQTRLAQLIDLLIEEDPQWASARAEGKLELPAGEEERYRLWRSLVNVRPPRAASASYLELEDAYLQEALRARGAMTLADIAGGAGRAAGRPAEGGHPDILLWQGDITRLAVDGIVNAANSQMLGCFAPCHGCIDNAVHTAAGVRLRLSCAELMAAQDGPEPTGAAKITPGFNLPARFVLHTVGPIVQGPWPTAKNRADLASCYRSCLELAAVRGLESLAFCCISTGEFRFPGREAARIAVDTVRGWQARARTEGRHVPVVVFNVFKDQDLAIYQHLLEEHHA